ncbi:MAG: hypothetical protein GXY44_06875 [Phycisphaerales bacterium]|nr:hypothetical protein [Phycisphaerales bacterium]
MIPSQPTPAPRALILAGPNGSGKTTFAREFLTAEGNCPTFLNADLIREWKQVGYVVKIVFLRLDSLEMAIARVQHRVRIGGHNIPESVILCRFEQGWGNFQNIYKPLLDSWQAYDAMKTLPVLIDEGGQA